MRWKRLWVGTGLLGCLLAAGGMEAYAGFQVFTTT